MFWLSRPTDGSKHLLGCHLSGANWKGVLTHLLNWKKGVLTSSLACVSCTWYGALWWPFFWAVGLATQTSMIQPASGRACPLGKRTLKGQKEAKTTDDEGKTS